MYSVLGLATIIAHSVNLLTAIKWLSSGYLIYLGWQGLHSKPKLISEINKLARSPDSIQSSTSIQSSISDSSTIQDKSSLALATIRRGFFCNVFNPKAPVYFVAVFTLVLSPNMPFWQLAIYGAWMMVIQLTWFNMVVMLLSIPTINRYFSRIEHWIDRVLGLAMIGLGLNLILRRLDA